MEIERKYLVEKIPFDLSPYKRHEIEQAYLCHKPTVRVRKKDGDFILTLKHDLDKESVSKDDFDRGHEEYEIRISKKAYAHLLEKHDNNIISKTRYLIPLDEKHTIELDVFSGKLEGLVYAEVEFESFEDADDFMAPEWFGREVTGEDGYSNYELSLRT